jgi:hypothetical protein
MRLHDGSPSGSHDYLEHNAHDPSQIVETRASFLGDKDDIREEEIEKLKELAKNGEILKLPDIFHRPNSISGLGSMSPPVGNYGIGGGGSSLAGSLAGSLGAASNGSSVSKSPRLHKATSQPQFSKSLPTLPDSLGLTNSISTPMILGDINYDTIQQAKKLQKQKHQIPGGLDQAKMAKKHLLSNPKVVNYSMNKFK